VIDRFVPVVAEAEYGVYQIQMNRGRGERSIEILKRDSMEYVSNNMTGLTPIKWKDFHSMLAISASNAIGDL